MDQRVTRSLVYIIHKHWLKSAKIRFIVELHVFCSVLIVMVGASSAAATPTESSPNQITPSTSHSENTNHPSSAFTVSPTVANMANDTNPAHRIYDTSKGPLRCNNVWPWLNDVPKGICHGFHWADGAKGPEFTCEGVEGFEPFAGSYTSLLHSTMTYQVEATANSIWINNNGTYERCTAWCAYRKIYDIRKVDSLADVPDGPINNYVGVVNFISIALKEGNSATDMVMPLVSEGLKHIRLEYGPRATVGVTSALLTYDNCFTCPAMLWSIEHGFNIDLFYRYLNKAQRILMEFNSAYISLATFLLHQLKRRAVVEELEVHGGKRWDDELLILTELKFLRTLDLSGNGISSLSDDNFARMPNLLNLNLSNNRFFTVPMGLKHLNKLVSLDLSKNPLNPTNLKIVLQSFTNLQMLNLSGVSLWTLDNLMIEETNREAGGKSSKLGKDWYSRLEVLDVSGCNVSSLETVGARSLWARAGSLRVLRLADNPLASVPPWLAQRLPALQELDLSGCLLAAPPALRLAPAQRLRRLLLARNLLATPRGALASGGGAGGGAAYLDVSGNPLRGEWGAGAFAPLGARVSVNLSRTRLTALSPQMLRSLQPLAQVDLGGNAFDCSSCSILPLQEWISNRTTPEVVSLGRRAPLVCQLPVPVRGRPLLEVEGPSPGECAPAGGGWSVGAIGGAVLVATFLVTTACVLLAVRFRLHLVYMLHVVRVNRTLKARSSDRRAQFDFDAFVCYSKLDRSWVLDELVPQLEGDEHSPYRLCLHERNFSLGSLIVQNIVECMERSRHTLIVLTPSFVESQWCQWELEMATHRLLEGAGRDFLVLVELQRLEARALPRLLRLLVETRTFLQWPPAAAKGGVGAGTEEAAWKRLRAALGPPLTASCDASKKINSDF